MTRPRDLILARSLAIDMLSGVFKGMVFRDLPLTCTPAWGWQDRGKLLEAAWHENMGAAWNSSFCDLASANNRAAPPRWSFRRCSSRMADDS